MKNFRINRVKLGPIKLILIISLIASTLLLSACQTLRERCTYEGGELRCTYGYTQMKSASEMEQTIDDLDIANLNAANLYIDFSGSTVGQIKSTSNPTLNIILKNGSAIVDSYSAPLSINSSRTRVYLSNPVALSSWANSNAGLFTTADFDLDGIDISVIEGNNLVLAELIHYGTVQTGASSGYYHNGGGGSGGGHNQQQ